MQDYKVFKSFTIYIHIVKRIRESRENSVSVVRARRHLSNVHDLSPFQMTLQQLNITLLC